MAASRECRAHPCPGVSISRLWRGGKCDRTGGGPLRPSHRSAAVGTAGSYALQEDSGMNH